MYIALFMRGWFFVRLLIGVFCVGVVFAKSELFSRAYRWLRRWS